jgi:hypothetical protein
LYKCWSPRSFGLVVAGCGAQATSPTSGRRASEAPRSTASGDATAAAADGLSAIGCATKDPEDIGGLTGAWAGDDDGIYYIRQVGDCVWWFGTSLEDVVPGQLAQPGFANVAAGRVDGPEINLEWADVPVGDILGGGGLSLEIMEDGDRLVVTRYEGDWGFGASSFSRIAEDGQDVSPSASAGASP